MNYLLVHERATWKQVAIGGFGYSATRFQSCALLL